MLEGRKGGRNEERERGERVVLGCWLSPSQKGTRGRENGVGDKVGLGPHFSVSGERAKRACVRVGQ